METVLRKDIDFAVENMQRNLVQLHKIKSRLTINRISVHASCQEAFYAAAFNGRLEMIRAVLGYSTELVSDTLQFAESFKESLGPDLSVVEPRRRPREAAPSPEPERVSFADSSCQNYANLYRILQDAATPQPTDCDALPTPPADDESMDEHTHFPFLANMFDMDEEEDEGDHRAVSDEDETLLQSVQAVQLHDTLDYEDSEEDDKHEEERARDLEIVFQRKRAATYTRRVCDAEARLEKLKKGAKDAEAEAERLLQGGELKCNNDEETVERGQGDGDGEEEVGKRRPQRKNRRAPKRLAEEE